MMPWWVQPAIICLAVVIVLGLFVFGAFCASASADREIDEIDYGGGM